MEIYNLYLLDSFNGDYINGYNNITVYLLSLFAIISGVLVIVSKNPIVSVLFLIGLFLNIVLYLISLGLNFIGLSYLLIYIGAISILFLFILINVRISELLIDSNNSIPLLIIILFEVFHIASIGNIMYTSYSIWLNLTSIILILVMFRCIVITINFKYIFELKK